MHILTLNIRLNCIFIQRFLQKAKYLHQFVKYIIVFMVMVDCLEMNNYFSKVNFKMD